MAPKNGEHGLKSVVTRQARINANYALEQALKYEINRDVNASLNILVF